jgi:hypothetical protein
MAHWPMSRTQGLAMIAEDVSAEFARTTIDSITVPG